LREKGVLGDISKLLREAGEEYRKLYVVLSLNIKQQLREGKQKYRKLLQLFKTLNYQIY
jgi:hypothetical protein